MSHRVIILRIKTCLFSGRLDRVGDLAHVHCSAMLCPFGSRTILRTVFLSWANTLLSQFREVLEAENRRLTDLVGQRSKSLWKMKKEDLVRAVVLELASTPNALTAFQAQALQVPRLRTMLRAHRESEGGPPAPPKGIATMKKAELLVVAENTPIDTFRANGKIKTNEELTMDIRDYYRDAKVAYYTLRQLPMPGQATPVVIHPMTPNQSSPRTTALPGADEWDMAKDL